jgi:hypothetical protein
MIVKIINNKVCIDNDIFSNKGDFFSKKSILFFIKIINQFIFVVKFEFTNLNNIFFKELFYILYSIKIY